MQWKKKKIYIIVLKKGKPKVGDRFFKTEKLAKEFHSKACLDYGQKMLKRFYLLSETKKGSQILSTALFEKQGELYESVIGIG